MGCCYQHGAVTDRVLLPNVCCYGSRTFPYQTLHYQTFTYFRRFPTKTFSYQDFFLPGLFPTSDLWLPRHFPTKTFAYKDIFLPQTFTYQDISLYNLIGWSAN